MLNKNVLYLFKDPVNFPRLTQMTLLVSMTSVLTVITVVLMTLSYNDDNNGVDDTG